MNHINCKLSTVVFTSVSSQQSVFLKHKVSFYFKVLDTG